MGGWVFVCTPAVYAHLPGDELVEKKRKVGGLVGGWVCVHGQCMLTC